MQNISRVLIIIATLTAVIGCSTTGSVPQNYYENYIHRGYPGPGISSPGGP
jgi:hypothetical protein